MINKENVDQILDDWYTTYCIRVRHHSHQHSENPEREAFFATLRDAAELTEEIYQESSKAILDSCLTPKE